MNSIFEHPEQFLLEKDEGRVEILEVHCPEIPIIIEGIKIQALIDTGSKISCISDRFYNKNFSKFKKCPTLPLVTVKATGFTGEQTKALKIQFSAKVLINQIQQIVHFLVIPNLVTDCILGADSQKSFKMLINTFELKIKIFDTEISYKKSITKKDDITIINNILNSLEQQNFTETIPTNTTNRFDLTKIKQKLREIEILNPREKAKLGKLIWKYRNIFSDIPGRIKDFEYKIALKDNQDYFFKSYPVPLKYRDKVDNEINRLLNLGIIKRSYSNYINPLVVVIKKNGSIRLCLDARVLNEKIINDYDCPEPLDEIFKDCGENGIMSNIDLTSSFWQIALHPDSSKYVAFMYKGKCYEFNVMPFGVKSATAALIRGTEKIAKDLRFVKNFVDDFLVKSKNFQEHLQHLNILFQRLESFGMTINFDKCHFCCNKLSFLGFVITPDGISADPEKFQKIRDFPAPKNVKQIQSFLGMLNFNSRFVEIHQEQISVLRRLTRKSIKWRWTEVEMSAFNSIKELFLKTVTLAHPDLNKPYHLYVDASDTAAGAILAQEVSTGDLRIINVASRLFVGAELSYFTTEKELLALRWALEKFRGYIFGCKIIVKTDHKALIFLNKCRFLSQRILRWALYIQQYDLEIEHIRGTHNCLADMMSRVHNLNKHNKDHDTLVAFNEISKTLNNSLKNISSLQKEDETLRTKFLKPKSPYHIINDILYKNNKICIPEKIVDSLITEAHQIFGHFGIKKTLTTLKEAFVFKKMRHRIARIIKYCDSCQRNKIDTQGSFAPMQTITPLHVNDLVSVDFYGPLPRSTGGVQYIFELIDVFSKFVIFYPIKRANAMTIIKKLRDDYFVKYGKPKTIQVDHGTPFVSKRFKSFLDQQNVNLTFSAITHPQSNTIERVNREIGRLCRTFIHGKHSQWASLISYIQDCLNNIVHDTTQFTPFELKFGKRPNRFWEKYFAIETHDMPYDQKLILVQNRIKKKGKIRADKFNELHKFTEFNIGDSVLVKTNRLSNANKQVTYKFLSIFQGPYIITRKLGIATYEISDHKGKVRGRFHASNIRRYFSHN